MFKKLFRGFLNLLFISTTIAFITAVTAVILLQPQNIKNWVQKSGAYTTLPNTLINQAAPEQTEATSDISLSNPIIALAAKETITSDFVQKSSEQIIDSLFAWLEGKTPIPTFSIDLSTIKQTFADKIVVATKDRYSKLPECKFGTLPKSSDPLTIECRPLYGVDINKVTEDLRTEILQNKEFLPESALTSTTLLGTGEANSIFNSNTGPSIYKSLQLAPFVLAGLILVFAGGIILLSKSKRYGLNRVGALMVLSGILATLSTWLATLAYGQYQDKLQIIAIGPFSDFAMPVIDAFRYDALKFTGFVSALVSAVGVVILIIGLIINKGQKKKPLIPKVPERANIEKSATETPLEAKPPELKTAPKVKMIKPKQQGSPTIITPTPTTAPEVVKPSKKLVQ